MHTRYTVHCQPDMREVLIAFMGEINGLDMFTETEAGVEAFAVVGHDTDYVQAELTDICAQFDAHFEVTEVESENWNETWESNFPKVIVDDFCAVRAEFHEPEPGVKFDLLIRPKMAFGTGHHQTTRMVLGAMRNIDFVGKSVFDYGCGTAVLAILAAKMGATDLLGVDNELPAAQNSLENAELNGVPNIEIIHGTLDDVPQRTYDVILANINRNIILHSLERLHSMSAPGTLLFTSGFLVSDADLITKSAGAAGFELVEKHQIDDWNCLVFQFKG
jgi:ribosomal protein L11 methyltransferase